jgi:hypothetical protein
MSCHRRSYLNYFDASEKKKRKGEAQSSAEQTAVSTE